MLDSNDLIKKLDELKELIKSDQKETNRSMSDFFKPISDKMVDIMRYRALSALERSAQPEYSSMRAFTNHEQRIMVNCINTAFNNVVGIDLINEASLMDENQELNQYLEISVRAGDKIQAIRHLKDKTGWGLKECKDYVDGISLKVKTEVLSKDARGV